MCVIESFVLLDVCPSRELIEGMMLGLGCDPIYGIHVMSTFIDCYVRHDVECPLSVMDMVSLLIQSAAVARNPLGGVLVCRLLHKSE